MRKIIALEYVTVNGVMEAPEEWQFPYLADDVQQSNIDLLNSMDAIIFGSVTYQILAAFWPNQANNAFGVADKLNSVRKYVVSSTLSEVTWNNSMLFTGNLADEITDLKQQPGGNIAIIGSAMLVQSLMKADLIDEYHLQIYPVVVGKGKRLFKDNVVTTALKLDRSQAFSSGVVNLIYQPAPSSTQ